MDMRAIAADLAEAGREMYRRARMEFIIEWPLLVARLKFIIFGALFQYVHGMFTQLAHRLHAPQEHLLPDLGFQFFPELGKKQEWVSETIFGCMFGSFIVWSFSPFFFQRKRFYTAVLYSRLLMVLVACQCLRIISFLVTSLPAPNYHCRAGEVTAVREPAEHWWQFFVVDVKRQSTHGCGDLIFSSHTTFALTGTLAYTEYGTLLWVKLLVWASMAVLSCLIVASRKHYSVDVVIAWYAVPLVFYAAHRRWTTKRPAEEFYRPGAQAMDPKMHGTELVVMEEGGNTPPGDTPGGSSMGAHGASSLALGHHKPAGESLSTSSGAMRQLPGVRPRSYGSTSQLNGGSGGGGNGGGGGSTALGVGGQRNSSGSGQRSSSGTDEYRMEITPDTGEYSRSATRSDAPLLADGGPCKVS